MYITLKDLSQEIKTRLYSIYTDSETRVITFALFHKAFQWTSAQVITNSDAKISISDYNQINDWVKRLENHEPLQYVTGEEEFYGIPFQVAPGVLIPRPETEELVQLIIQSNQITNPSILDIGTGSGCIAVALAKNLPQSKVVAIDISSRALEIAERNAHINAVEIDFLQHDILSGNPLQWDQNFDMIVSNPPYVTENEKQFMQANVLEYEPPMALFVSNNDPLVFYRQIAILAQKWLKSGGKLYFEINEHFGLQMRELLHKLGYINIVIHKDINQKERMTQAVWKLQ